MSSSVEGDRRTSVSASAYTEVQQSERFQELKRRHRSIVFPLTAIFLAWYFLYVLLADYAHDFMSHKLWGNINVGLVIGPAAVRVDVRDHRHLRPASRTRTSTRSPPRCATSSRAVPDDPPRGRHRRRRASRQPRHLPALRGGDPRHRLPGLAPTTRPPPTTTPPAGRSPARRTASPSPATTCRPRRSSASPGPSPSTGTTASCTRSASWWPGWWRCCSSPSCSATPAGSPWPTSCPSGCGSGRSAWPPRSPPWPSRSST